MVVDNDPEASAREVVASFAGFGVRYVHEPAPGIAHGRNRALDESAGARLLIFIDDDERPCPGWLAAMLATYERTGAAGVTGPVYPDYEGEPDPWLVAAGIFIRKEYPDGTRCRLRAPATCCSTWTRSGSSGCGSTTGSA